jgi:hypothetical protein
MEGRMIENCIKSYNSNLENLRDFVVTISEFLESKRKEKLREDPLAMVPMILALNKSNPDSMSMPDSQLAKLKKGFGDDFEFTVDVGDDGAESFKFKFGEGQQERFESALRHYSKSNTKFTNLYNSSLINLISTSEHFLAQLIHIYFNQSDGAIGAGEKTFSLDDLRQFDSVDDAKKHLVDLKVEGILRGSFLDWVKFLRQTVKLNAGYIDIHVDYLYEASLRRNLLIHNGGVVNSTYLKNLPSSISEKPSIGDVLEVSQSYLDESISRFELGICLSL